MECIGKNPAGNFCACVCCSFQNKWCKDGNMETNNKIRNNFNSILQASDWNSATICEPVNSQDKNKRVCFCLGGQRENSCDSKMRIVSMTKADIVRHIEHFNC